MKQFWFSRIIGCALAVVVCALATAAADQARSTPTPLRWTKGPLKVGLRNMASLAVPAEFLFLDEPQTKVLLEQLGYSLSGREVGVLGPATGNWLVIVEFLDVGFVSTREWSRLDAAALLNVIRAANDKMNEEQESHKRPPVRVVGWALNPSYDPETDRVEWAVRAESDGASIVNQTISVLGRSGAVQFTLVDRHQLASTLSAFHDVVAGFAFNQGERYSEKRLGDPLARGGLAALVSASAGSETEETVLTAPDSVPPKNSRLPRYWWIVVPAVILAGFVSEQWRKSRRRKFRSLRDRRAFGAGHSFARAVGQAPGIQSASPALAGVAPGGSPVAVESGPTPGGSNKRSKRYDNYSFYCRLTRDLHWTINY